MPLHKASFAIPLMLLKLVGWLGAFLLLVAGHWLAAGVLFTILIGTNK